MTDQYPMPFGMHKGKSMDNVPDSYLKRIYGQLMVKLESGLKMTNDEVKVLAYIEDFGLENLNTEQ